MSWTATQNTLEDLRHRLDNGEDIRREAARLRREAESLAADGSDPVSEIAPEIAETVRQKADLVREHLLVGDLGISEDADEKIRAIIRSARDRVIGSAVKAEVEQKISEHVAETADAQRQIEELSARERAAASMVEVLRGYLELLDAVCAPPGTGPRR